MDSSMEKLDIQDPAGIEAWHERFGFYVTTNNRINDKNVTAWYLTLIGKEAYNLLKDLAFPDKLADKTIPELQEVLTNIYDPITSKQQKGQNSTI